MPPSATSPTSRNPAIQPDANRSQDRNRGYLSGSDSPPFDGAYRVATGEFGQIAWWSMLLMKLPDSEARRLQAASGPLPMIIDNLLAKHRTNFTDKSGKLIRFPFGGAYCGTDGSEVAGHLAFDLQDSMAILFIPLDGGPPRRIAATFEQMMHRAAFESFG